MKTSRKDGILVIQTEKPYTMTINGQFEKRNTIICHDVNTRCEAAAYDLEQQLILAMTNIPANNSRKKTSQKQIIADEKQDKKFFDADCPTDSEISKQAQALEMMVNMNNAVRISEFMETFNDFLTSGAVCIDGDQKMQPAIWETISRKDKARIVFWYCAFFVNPSERLAAMAQSMDDPGLSEATDGQQTPSE